MSHNLSLLHATCSGDLFVLFCLLWGYMQKYSGITSVNLWETIYDTWGLNSSRLCARQMPYLLYFCFVLLFIPENIIFLYSAMFSATSLHEYTAPLIIQSFLKTCISHNLLSQKNRQETSLLTAFPPSVTLLWIRLQPCTMT